MSYMTWDQFKEAVDAELKKIGATGKEEIAYINVDRPCHVTGISVEIGNNLLRITY